MDWKKIVEELERNYPGKKIIKLPQEQPTEILCEVVPTVDNPEKSVAIAVIDRSAPHYHKVTTEEYEVLRGKLTVFINEMPITLYEGERLVIDPGKVHYAVGEECFIKCTATPGWTAEDHILVDANERRE